MNVKIDVNGNINIDGEASATPQYALLLFLYLMAQAIGETLEYDAESQISDIEYDEEHDRLSWMAWGAEQSYSFNSPTLIHFIKEATSAAAETQPATLFEARDGAYFDLASRLAGALELIHAYENTLAEQVAYLKKLTNQLKSSLSSRMDGVEKLVNKKANQNLGIGAANAALTILEVATK